MRWPLQPLQPFQQTQLQPPFGQSVDSLCHPWFTTTNVSYRFPILKLPPPPCAVLLVCTHHYIYIRICIYGLYTSFICIYIYICIHIYIIWIHIIWYNDTHIARILRVSLAHPVSQARWHQRHQRMRLELGHLCFDHRQDLLAVARRVALMEHQWSRLQIMFLKPWNSRCVLKKNTRDYNLDIDFGDLWSILFEWGDGDPNDD